MNNVQWDDSEVCFSSEQQGFVSGDLPNPSQDKSPGCSALRHTNCFGKGAVLDFLTGLDSPNAAGTRKKRKARRENSARRLLARRERDLNAGKQAVGHSKVHPFETKAKKRKIAEVSELQKVTFHLLY